MTCLSMGVHLYHVGIHSMPYMGAHSIPRGSQRCAPYAMHGSPLETNWEPTLYHMGAHSIPGLDHGSPLYSLSCGSPLSMPCMGRGDSVSLHCLNLRLHDPYEPTTLRPPTTPPTQVSQPGSYDPTTPMTHLRHTDTCSQLRPLRPLRPGSYDPL